MNHPEEEIVVEEIIIVEGDRDEHERRHPEEEIIVEEVIIVEDDRDEHHHHHRDYEIQIDRTKYTVKEHELTGMQLRNLPSPPIGADRDLFEVVPGGSDRKIEATDKVHMRDGLRFFTAPAQINPGLERKVKELRFVAA